MKISSTLPEEGETHYSQHPNRDKLIQAVRDLGKALDSAKQRSQQWLAWQQLNVTDEHGLNKVMPYTEEAIATLETSFALDESNCEVIHHLAVAYHAMAWDLELRESNAASDAWQKALFYWRKLQSCGTFWQNLCDKGETLGEGFDRSVVEAFRQNLIQYLIEIHVSFIRHYYEHKKQEQAARHIELIKRARIPPVARKELEALAYQAMASTVPNVVAEGRFGDALTMLDGLLSLFPSYLPALQTYLEVAKQWVEQMSPSSQWQEILELDKRVFPRWSVLNASGHLTEHSLARVALGDLATVLGSKHWARARSLRLQREEAGQQPQVLECEEYQAYERAISWLKKAESHISDNLGTQVDLFNALMSRATFATNVGLSSNNPDVTHQLLAEALSDCQEAMKVAPEEATPHELAEQISRIKEYIN